MVVGHNDLNVKDVILTRHHQLPCSIENPSPRGRLP